MNNRIVRLVLALAIFFGSAPKSWAQQEDIVLKFAVTTDVHGAYFPIDWFTGKPLKGSLAHVSTWVGEQRRLTGKNLILLDNGDLIQGDPASYYSNFIDTGKPNIAARILNYLDYSAGSIGNHDLEAGHAVYDKLNKEFRFPWLSANSIKTGTEDPWFKPYLIITRSGVRIAILGLTTPKIPDWLPPALWSGMEFHDMIEAARKWVALIRTEENPHLIIGLFHSGVDPNYGQQSAEMSRNENAARLVAERVSGFDVVFTGHDHRTWNFHVADPDGDSVLILGSGSRASEIAVATIRLHREGSSLNVSAIDGQHVTMSDYTPDPAFLDHFRGYIDSVRRYVEQPVGTISKTIGSEDAWFGPSELVGLIHQAQLELTGADISFTAPLSFRTGISKGPLLVKDLFSLYRFENQLYTITLTGAEIAGYLNYSYSLWMNTMTGPDDTLLRMEQQSDGSWRLKNAYYNFDSAAGIDYVVDLSKPAGQMVTIDRLSDGRDFELAATYTVALNSYRGSGGGGHLSTGAGLEKEEVATRLISASDMDFRFLLGEWIRDKGTITPVTPKNWKTIPESWTRSASVRDAGRLFNK